MSPRHAALSLLLAALPFAAAGATSVAGKAVAKAAVRATAPTLRLAAFPPALERSIAWPALQPAAAVRASPEDKRMRVGIARDAAADGVAAGELTWLPSPDGGRVAHVRASSPGAAALRVGLALKALPRGLELRVADRAGHAPAPIGVEAIEASMRQQGVYWTPLTEGDAQVVELWVPDDAAAPPRVEVAAASHLLAGPAHLFKSASGASQSCEENVACVAGGNPALARAASSVAKLLYTESGVTYLCTGTLVADADRASQVPYLLTAAHCMGSQAAAASLNTFWFFQSPSCGDKTAPSYRQLSGGASLLFADSDDDVALVRLHDAAPEGAWFSGWDTGTLATGTAIVSLHHPAGDVTKVSLGQSLDPVGAPPASFTGVAWTSGTTEGGSSGSGLFTFDGRDYVLRGALRGGSASCLSSGSIANPANRDYFSRLDLASSAIAKWLATPGGPLDDYGGLWFDADEPGWGLSIVQDAQGHVFAALFAYDADGQPTWLVMPAATWTGGATLTGALYRTHGSALDAPYDPALFTVAAAGTLRLQFLPGAKATATFEIDGRTLVKAIGRQPL